MDTVKSNASSQVVNPTDIRSIWNGIQKSARYLSDWADDTITIDVQTKGRRKTEPYIFALSKIYLSVSGELSIYGREPTPLSHFPDFCTSLKFAINSELRNKDFNHQQNVTRVVNDGIRFFSFCIGRGVYRLADVTRELITEYRDRILRLGWWDAHEYDAQLKMFLEKMKGDRNLQKQIITSKSKNTAFSIAIFELEKLTGLRIPRNSLPMWFYDSYRKIINSSKPSHKRSDSSDTGIKPSQSAARSVFYSINLLCFSREGFDTIPFIAFPRASKICADYFKASRNDKRTATLTLPVAVTIVQEAMRWLYEYGPTLLEISNDIREQLEAAEKDDTSDVARRQKLLHRMLTEGFERFQSKHDLQIAEFKIQTQYTDKFRILIITYQSALFFCVAATTARRRNEISGEERTYGLYFGCLRKVLEDFEDYKVDFYVEKTLQDYKEFWASKLCVDSIKVLEELSQVFRPIGDGRKVPEHDIDAARSDKLFVVKYFKATPPYITEAVKFVASIHSEYFFRLCGVDKNIVFNKNRNIFRRFYSNLFINRYDNPIASALQNHLDHSSISGTAIYGLDPHGRAAKDKSSTVFRIGDVDDDESFRAVMAEVSHEHHVAKIVELLEGKPVGGLYSRLVLKLTTRLSKDSIFALQPVEIKAQIIGDKMNRRGFASAEKAHGMCMAGTARHAMKKANCARQGEIHPEAASPELCNGCINLLNPEGYQRHLAEERDALLAEAADMTLPRALREAKKRDAAQTDAYLESHRRIAEGNKQILAKLVESWSKLEELSDK